MRMLCYICLRIKIYFIYIYIYVQSTFDNIFNSILTKQYLRRSKDPSTGFRNKR